MTNFIELAAAGNRSKEILKQQLVQSDGRIDIVVHPHFNDDWKRSPFPRSNAIKNAANKYYEDLITKGNPLVLFLEADARLFPEDPDPGEKASAQFSSRLSPEISGTAYVVYTEAADPKPLSPRSVWPKVVQTLQESGADTAVMSGQYLVKYPLSECLQRKKDIELYHFAQLVTELQSKPDSHPSWPHGDVVYGGCVGVTAMWFLYEGFNVEFSPHSNPNLQMTPEEFNKRVVRGPKLSGSIYPFGRIKSFNSSIYNLVRFFDPMSQVGF